MKLARCIPFLLALFYAAKTATAASSNANNDASASSFALQIATENGRIVKLGFASGPIPLQVKGGFRLIDFPANAAGSG